LKRKRREKKWKKKNLKIETLKMKKKATSKNSKIEEREK
jgi:hypothetical protein